MNLLVNRFLFFTILRIPKRHGQMNKEKQNATLCQRTGFLTNPSLCLILALQFFSHAPAYTSLCLEPLLSHNTFFPRVHQCVMGNCPGTHTHRLGSSSLILAMSSTLLLPPREQLCNRSCSNKHTHTHNLRGSESSLRLAAAPCSTLEVINLNGDTHYQPQ
jgi:hypothetical protein